MKKKIFAIMLSGAIAAAMMAGCAASKSGDVIRKNNADSRSGATSEMAMSDEAVYAEETYAAVEPEAFDEEGLDMEYYDADNSATYSGKSDAADPSSNRNAASDVSVNAKKDMLVYRANIKLDTTNFEEAVANLKAKIAEYHGFIENETQSDGSAYTGKYVLAEDGKDYLYVATIRIPSEHYENFVNSTEGLGYLRSKNSSVENVATTYGTLKNELEIYEKEYDRYLKQYEETKDEEIALRIQSELRNLAITISDIKTRMSYIENDVAYSYVTITIHKVTVEEIQEIEEIETTPDTFGVRVKKAASESWENLLDFLEGILMFFIGAWWGLLILAIIAAAIVIIIKVSIKKSRKRREKALKLQEEKRKQLEASKAAQKTENKAEKAPEASNGSAAVKADGKKDN